MIDLRSKSNTALTHNVMDGVLTNRQFHKLDSISGAVKLLKVLKAGRRTRRAQDEDFLDACVKQITSVGILK